MRFPWIEVTVAALAFSIFSVAVTCAAMAVLADETPRPVPYVILDERTLKVRTQAADMVADVENAKGRGIEERKLTGWIAMPREEWDAMMRKGR